LELPITKDFTPARGSQRMERYSKSVFTRVKLFHLRTRRLFASSASCLQLFSLHSSYSSGRGTQKCRARDARLGRTRRII